LQEDYIIIILHYFFDISVAIHLLIKHYFIDELGDKFQLRDDECIWNIVMFEKNHEIIENDFCLNKV